MKQIFFILLFCVCEGFYDEAENIKKLRILMVSDFAFGHLAPLLPLGEELVQRGHNVSLLLIVDENKQEKYKNHVEKFGVHLWNVSSEHLPSFNFTQMSQEMSKGLIVSALKLADYLPGFASIMTKHMNKSLSNNDWDIVISYFFIQSVAICMHSVHNVPFVLVGHFPLATHLYPAWPWPSLIRGAMSDDMGFLDRALSVPARIAEETLGYMILRFSYMSTLSQYCSTISREVMTDPGIHIPAIVHSVIGFEYSRTITPLTEYIGPLLSRHPAPLPGKLREWLENKPNKSVVYISMGSMFSLDKNSGKALFEGVMKTNLSILWSLRKSNQDILEDIDIDPDRVMISDWTPQFTVLQSSAIHSAILHGGINGLSEALWSGVPVIVVPQMPEQAHSAGRVHFNGLGIYLDSKTLSSEKITESLKSLDTGKYRSKVSDLQKMYRLAGGVERAADLIEFYEDVGYAHLVPAYAKYQWSWVQYYNADVYAVILLTVVAVIMCFLACCRCLCRKCCDSSSKQKKD